MMKLMCASLIFLFCSLPQLEAQSLEKMLMFRTGDSLWIYPRVFGSNLFFIGDEKVNRRQWWKHMEKGDAEVNELLMRGQKHRRTGNIVFVSGIASLGIGLMTINAFDPAVSTIGSVLFIGGLTTEIFTTIFYTKAGRYYVQGLRLYNYKANRGELQSITLHAGPGDHGVGLMVRW